jgi:alkanesulfonate monooxygenase SsuD/methylene tetrahydromethanopterin reductase-like flavin-dependent oxidoreductase (luciferase family)
MRTGLFCTYENPHGDYRSAYAEQTELVELVEALGYDEAWIAEHHFNATATSPSPFPIVAHLAARTSRLRLGTAAVLLPFRDPVLVAEDVATVDILSGGRFDLGVARGGPFPEQNRHFGVGPDEARARTSEALALIQRLLAEDEVTFDGAFYKADGVVLHPKPLQRPVPTYYATSTTGSIALAARHGYGLMTAAPAPLSRAYESVRLYRQAAPGIDPRMVLFRFFHLAPTRAEAIADAEDLLRPFVERKRRTSRRVEPEAKPWLTALIEDSLVGTQADVLGKVAQIQQELGARSLVLKPLSPDLAKRKADLRIFSELIARRPAPAPTSPPAGREPG